MRFSFGFIKAVTEFSPRGRMVRGVLANVYDKSAVTLVQLLTIPVLTKAWGAEGYGIWLMLLTVPTYIALSDLGFGTAAGVVLTQCSNEKKYEKANMVLNSTIAFVVGAVSIVVIFAFLFAVWLYQYGEQSKPFSHEEIALSVVFITCYSLVLTQMNIVTVVYRSTHKFAFAMVFSGTWILFEGIVLVSFVSYGIGLVEVAIGYFLIRLIGYVLFVSILKAKEPWVRIDFALARRKIIRELANPSAAALGLTFAATISLQGMILALGSSVGPAIVAVFGAARTLSRAPLQISGLLLRPSIPELTRAISGGDGVLVRRLSRLNVIVALALTVPFGFILIVAGPWLLNFLSDGAMNSGHSIFVFLAIAASANATWMAISASLIAMNKQSSFSYVYLILSILSVSLVMILSPFYDAVNVAAIAMSVTELLLVAWIYGVKMRMFGK
jgi:O-antigen/teichoic acid export membrane protein